MYKFSLKRPFNEQMTILLFWVILAIRVVAGQTFQEELLLRSNLLSNYSRKIVPIWNQTGVLDVHVKFNLLSIYDLDEKREIFRSSGNLEMVWNNEILTWNPADYGGIETILLDPKEIWTPDVVVESSVNPDRFVGTDDVFIRIFYTGDCTWYPGSVMETQCSVTITQYPFDTQTCDVTFIPWMNPSHQVRLVARQSTINMDLFQRHGEWEILSTSMKDVMVFYDAPYSRIVCTLQLKRRAAYHVLNTLLPVMLLSVLNVLVFVIPPECGEKMSLSITILLAYAVFLSIINEDMPSNSNSVSILAVYVVLVLAAGTTSTFLTAIVLHFAYTEESRDRKFSCCTWGYSRPDRVYGEKMSVFVNNTDGETDKNCATPEQDGNGTSRNKHYRMASPIRKQLSRQRLVDRIDVASFWIITVLIALITFIAVVLLTVEDF